MDELEQRVQALLLTDAEAVSEQAADSPQAYPDLAAELQRTMMEVHRRQAVATVSLHLAREQIEAAALQGDTRAPRALMDECIKLQRALEQHRDNVDKLREKLRSIRRMEAQAKAGRQRARPSVCLSFASIRSPTPQDAELERRLRELDAELSETPEPPPARLDPPPPAGPRTRIGQCARDALRQRGHAQLLSRLRAASANMREAQAKAHATGGRVGFWDRLNPLDSDRELSAEAARAEADLRRGEYDALVVLAEQELVGRDDFVPLSVVFRIEWLIERVLAGRSVGSAQLESHSAATELDAIASDLATVWAPGVKLNVVAKRLADDSARQAVRGARLDPPAEHWKFGWAPLSETEIFTRVAQALDAGEDLRAATATLAREQSESATAAHELQRATAFGPSGSHDVDRLRASLAREEGESQWAEEWVRLAVHRAFAVHPVLRLYNALRSAAAAARTVSAASTADERAQAPAAPLRVVLLACLVDIRHASDAAFPEVREQLWAEGPQQPAVPGEHGSPYRARPTSAAANGEATLGGLQSEAAEAKRAAWAALERHGVQKLLAVAVDAAVMLAILEQDRPTQPGIAQASAAASPGELAPRVAPTSAAAASVPERIAHYRGLLTEYGLRCLSCVQTMADSGARRALSSSAADFKRAVDAIRTDAGNHSSARACSVLGRREAEDALRSVRICLADRFGVRASEEELLAAAVELVATAAGSIEDEHSLGPLSQEQLVCRLAHHLQRMLPATTVGDASQTSRSALQARVHTFRVAMANNDAEAERVVSDVLSSYPPLSLLPKLTAAERALRDMDARATRRTRRERALDHRGRARVRTRTVYGCELVGYREAKSAAAILESGVHYTFSALPSAAELPEQWLSRVLQGTQASHASAASCM